MRAEIAQCIPAIRHRSDCKIIFISENRFSLDEKRVCDFLVLEINKGFGYTGSSHCGCKRNVLLCIAAIVVIAFVVV